MHMYGCGRTYKHGWKFEHKDAGYLDVWKYTYIYIYIYVLIGFAKLGGLDDEDLPDFLQNGSHDSWIRVYMHLGSRLFSYLDLGCNLCCFKYIWMSFGPHVDAIWVANGALITPWEQKWNRKAPKSEHIDLGRCQATESYLRFFSNQAPKFSNFFGMCFASVIFRDLLLILGPLEAVSYTHLTLPTICSV